MREDRFESSLCQKKEILPGAPWGSQGIHWSKEALKPLHGSPTLRGVSQAKMEPLACPKPLLMSAVCLLAVIGGVGRVVDYTQRQQA